MADTVSEWITGALTEPAKTAARMKVQKRAIEAEMTVPELPADDMPAKRQTAGGKGAKSRQERNEDVVRLLSDGTPRTMSEVAQLAGVSETQVHRIKRTMPTPIRSRQAQGG